MTVGVIVETTANPGSTEVLRDPGAAFFVVGQAERGAVTGSTLIRSMAEYEQKLGARVAYGALWDALAAFFAEGGARAHVARVVGPAATVGTLTLVDRAGVPANTLRIDAASPGAWSAGVTIEVDDGTVANTFTVTVRVDGVVVEQYHDIASPADAVTVINGRSGYITATNLGSATAAPNNNPAVSGPTALSAGTDDRAAITATTYTAALDRFGPELGAGAVAIPGQTAATVGPAVIAHAKARRRTGLLAPAAGSTPAAAISEATGLRNTTGSEHAGVFYPWVTVPDGSGGTRTVSPEGYVAGVRARAHRVGPWRAAAGEIAAATYVAGLERTLTRDDRNTLNDSRVNPIVSVAGTVRTYGWRSLSVDTVNYLNLTAVDTLNVIATRAEVLLERFVFRSVDGRGHLFSELEGELVGILEPMRAAGGLYERTDDEGIVLDDGYSVDTGPAVNPPAQLALGEVAVQVAVRVSPTAELIRLRITKTALTAAL